MQVQKTIKVKVGELSKRKQNYLESALKKGLKCTKDFLQLSKENKTTSNKKLHHLGYKKLVRKYKLPACIIHQSRNKCVEIMRSWWKNIRRGKKRHQFPEPKALRVRYDNVVFRLEDTQNKKYPYFASILVASRTRIRIPLIVNSNYQKEYVVDLLKGKYKKGSTDLVKKKGYYFIYLTISKEVNIPKPTREFAPVGCDVGINNLAVVVVPQQSVKFFSGKRVIWKRKHFAKIRQDLQKRLNTNLLNKIKGRERRFVAHLNHNISSYIVEQAKKLEKPVIVMEKLRYIREKTKVRKKQRVIHESWTFRQLQRMIEWKANWEGIPVVYINPEYTSQICPKCFSINKRQKYNYKCKYCGYEANSDFVGATNIYKQFWNAISFSEQALINCALDIANSEPNGGVYQGIKKIGCVQKFTREVRNSSTQ